jgi:hypothetical protein
MGNNPAMCIVAEICLVVGSYLTVVLIVEFRWVLEGYGFLGGYKG